MLKLVTCKFSLKQAPPSPSTPGNMFIWEFNQSQKIPYNLVTMAMVKGIECWILNQKRNKNETSPKISTTKMGMLRWKKKQLKQKQIKKQMP